jgi:hypothetical protein
MSNSPTLEFKSTVGAVMIRVPAGSFTMGSPASEDGHRVWEQQRDVTVVNDFYLGQFPVTQTQYDAVTGTNPTEHEVIGDAPVTSLTWESANEYCLKVTELDCKAGVLPDGWEYRLPTQAEWEYACRAGSSEPRHGPPLDVAWHHDNADERPHAVGIDDFPTRERPPSIFDAINANDFDLALRIITADPAAIESVDGIPPPLHDCIYHDRPQWLEWLLDHGADIERLEQDYGATPLTTAVVMRQKRIIPILVRRGAKTEGQLKRARNGLAGTYEDADASLHREGYREIVDLLAALGIEE